MAEPRHTEIPVKCGNCQSDGPFTIGVQSKNPPEIPYLTLDIISGTLLTTHYEVMAECTQCHTKYELAVGRPR